jgi:hypothetical protein
MNTTMNNANYAAAPTDDSWGFFGTIDMNERLGLKETIEAWDAAFTVFRRAPWQPTDITIRNFLRSRWGRHFADSTSFYEGSLIPVKRLSFEVTANRSNGLILS